MTGTQHHAIALIEYSRARTCRQHRMHRFLVPLEGPFLLEMPTGVTLSHRGGRANHYLLLLLSLGKNYGACKGAHVRCLPLASRRLVLLLNLVTLLGSPLSLGP